jgi:hypothetical protein
MSVRKSTDDDSNESANIAAGDVFLRSKKLGNATRLPVTSILAPSLGSSASSGN